MEQEGAASIQHLGRRIVPTARPLSEPEHSTGSEEVDVRSIPTKAAAICVLALALAVGTGPVAAQQKKGNCFLAGGESTMVTGDLARFMANAALANSIKGANAKASGAVKMTCKDATLSTHCLAQQRACK
jgi:hypothetical protein